MNPLARGTGTSHGNGESSRASIAASTSQSSWSGPALHGGVISHGYLKVGEIPPWPVKQSPVYHLAAVGRYGIDTPISGPKHLQPGIGYERSLRRPLGIDDNERPSLSPEIREILRKYSPKTQGLFRKHLPPSERWQSIDSTAAGHQRNVALDPPGALPKLEVQSTFSSSKAIARHDSFPRDKATTQKRGHQYGYETAQKPGVPAEPQMNWKRTGKVSDLQYVQMFAQEPGDSTGPQENFELPYVGHKRRFEATYGSSSQQDLKKVPITPTRQIAVAESRLQPKGQTRQRSPIVISSSPSPRKPIVSNQETPIPTQRQEVQVPPPRKRRNVALLSTDRIDSSTYVSTLLQSGTGGLHIKGLTKNGTLEIPSSPPVNNVSKAEEQEEEETPPESKGNGRALRPRNTKNEAQPTSARSGTSRYALRDRGPPQEESAHSPKDSPKRKKQKTTRGKKS